MASILVRKFFLNPRALQVNKGYYSCIFFMQTQMLVEKQCLPALTLTNYYVPSRLIQTSYKFNFQHMLPKSRSREKPHELNSVHFYVQL